MAMSPQGMAFLLAEEGIVLKPYRDSVGVWTIGGGHTAAAGPPDPRKMPPHIAMSIEEALSLFKKDVQKYNDRVHQAVKVPLKQHQEDALTSFHYNTGGINRAKLTQALNAGNYELAGDRFMGWIRPRSIVPRRTREMRLFDDGIYGDRKIPIWGTNNVGRLRGITGHLEADAAIRILSGGPEEPVEGGWPVLRRGDTGNEVEALQELLTRQGHDLMADGIFGPGTERALIEFQRGLVEYGKTGPLTWVALGKEERNT